MEIKLYWTDIKNIEALRFSQAFKGVYIWGFRIKSEFIPYYVGITRNIEHRLTEHVNFLVGGKYTIYHKGSLSEFLEYKDKGLNKSGDEGIIYIPNWPKGYHEFLDKRKSLQEHLDFMVDHMMYTYAAIDDEDIQRKELLIIEKNCIHEIGKNQIGNTRVGNYSNKIKLIHLGNKEVTKYFDKNRVQPQE